MIRTAFDGAVLWLDIERDEVRNALDLEHLTGLLSGLRRARSSSEIRCVVLRGVGRDFSVGADIRAMDTMTDDEFRQAAELYQSLAREARALDQPILAAIRGHALGGGLELALMADVRIAGRSARLGLPDAELGFSPTGGLTYHLGRVVGSGWAMHLALTCEVLDAERGLAIGLVTEVVDDDTLDAHVAALAARLAAYPVTGMRNIKRAFTRAEASTLEEMLVIEAEYDTECYRDPETRRNLRAFLDARRKG